MTRDTSALFQTDSLHYTLAQTASQYQTEIGVVFTNRTARTASFMNCLGSTGVRLERRDGTAWRVAWVPIMRACFSTPIDVASGASHRMTVPIFAELPGSRVQPQFAPGDPNGTYRRMWTDVVHDDGERHGAEGERSLPADARVSNEFSLVVVRK